MSDTPKLVKAYIKIRDKRGEIKRKYEEEDEALKQQLELIEASLADVCRTIGADSLKTDEGTVIRSIKTFYWTSDWESMYAFIQEHNAPHLLERRVSQTAIKEFLQANPEAMPKGLNTESKYSIVIRRKTA